MRDKWLVGIGRLVFGTYGAPWFCFLDVSPHSRLVHDERSLALHFSMPKWLSCRLVNISWRTLGGMTRDSPLNTRPSIMWSSSHSGQYSRVQVGVSLLYAGHPLMMRVITICRASSTAVAFFRKFILSLEINWKGGNQTVYSQLHFLNVVIFSWRWGWRVCPG